MDEKGKMSARKKKAKAAAFQPDEELSIERQGSTGDEVTGENEVHPTWLDRVREAAAPGTRRTAMDSGTSRPG